MRMSKKEFEERVRYQKYYFITYPVMLCIGIYVVGLLIEELFGFPLGIGKQIFAGMGGVGYFVWYFRKKIMEVTGMNPVKIIRGNGPVWAEETEGDVEIVGESGAPTAVYVSGPNAWKHKGTMKIVSRR